MDTKFADEGFVVLVHIPVAGGKPQREVYLVGYATQQECEAAVRAMYPSESVSIHCTPLTAANIGAFRLVEGEIRAWH
jgi:hypothetical protein